MLFKKTSFLFFMFLLMGGVWLFLYDSFYSIWVPYFSLSLDAMSNFFFLFSFDNISILFFIMVSAVVSLVLMFSEFYLEHYNVKKFFSLTLLFISSMVLLTSSSSILNAVIGWDGLGFSSLFLIMFYPNKTAMSNSFLTMIFNRVGDVILIVAMSVLVLCHHPLSFVEINISWLGFFLLICSFTKSAQFPLSSWLPAAMSAPTPISAMVHSSTLVTAGCFVVMKTLNLLILSGASFFLHYISLLTFLLGGLLATTETDLKKIVAFSTMSQISLIMLMVSASCFSLSICHMLYHALFKTLLFCSCGLMFMKNFSDQYLKIFKNMNPFISLLFFVSIFSMTGLVFSSSFYSKDIFAEKVCSDHLGILLVLLCFGSFFTIVYSMKLLDTGVSLTNKSNMMSSKKLILLYFMVFSLITLFCSNLKYLLFSDLSASVMLIDLIVVFFLINLYIFYSFNFVVSSTFEFSNSEVFLMKWFTFSLFGSMVEKNVFSISWSSFSEFSIFKTTNFFSGRINILNSNKGNVLFVLFLFIFVVFLF